MTPKHTLVRARALVLTSALWTACADVPEGASASEAVTTDTTDSTGGTPDPLPASTSASGADATGTGGEDPGADSTDPTTNAPDGPDLTTANPDPDTGPIDPPVPPDPDDPPPPPPPDPDCTAADDACDGDKLLTCVNGEFQATLCSQAWCAQQGLGNSLGCGYDDGQPGCQCEPALECFDGESMCVGPDSGKDCIDGFWSDTLSCDTYCQQNGYDLSLSCTQVAKTAVCDCRFSCQPGKDKYACSQDLTGIFACENSGAWSPYMDCDDVCQDLGYIGSFGCQWFGNYQQFACNCY